MCALFFRALAILAAGIVIKTMDDLLDEADLRTIPYYARLGNGLIPYTLALFSLALACHFQLAFGLFWASYCVGMLQSPAQKLPSAVRAWLETILGAIIMLICLGFSATLWSLTIIGAVQLVDDYLDYEQDRAAATRSAALLWGRTECFLVMLILLYCSVWLQPLDSLLVWSFALLIGNGKLFSGRRDVNRCT